MEILHDSVVRLRQAAGRDYDDRGISQLETALGEIGANVLTHGSPTGSVHRVEYILQMDGGSAIASFTDSGPQVHNHLARPMPAPTSEVGRGLALARLLLDELGYRREDGVNRWRLVKRL